MKKEEVLELSRKENLKGDERERKIKSRTRVVMMNAMYITAIIFLLVNQHFNREITFVKIICDIVTIAFIVDFARYIYLFIVEKDKSYLGIAVFDLLIIFWDLWDLFR